MAFRSKEGESPVTVKDSVESPTPAKCCYVEPEPSDLVMIEDDQSHDQDAMILQRVTLSFVSSGLYL